MVGKWCTKIRLRSTMHSQTSTPQRVRSEVATCQSSVKRHLDPILFIVANPLLPESGFYSVYEALIESCIEEALV